MGSASSINRRATLARCFSFWPLGLNAKRALFLGSATLPGTTSGAAGLDARCATGTFEPSCRAVEFGSTSEQHRPACRLRHARRTGGVPELRGTRNRTTMPPGPSVMASLPPSYAQTAGPKSNCYQVLPTAAGSKTRARFTRFRPDPALLMRRMRIFARTGTASKQDQRNEVHCGSDQCVCKMRGARYAKQQTTNKQTNSSLSRRTLKRQNAAVQITVFVM